MGAGLFLIAILGCGESDAPCRELRIAAPRFASAAACIAATPSVLERYLDLPFPSVVAQCRPAGAEPVRLRGSDVLRPGPRPAPRLRIASARPA
jgi:hypothetical protein